MSLLGDLGTAIKNKLGGTSVDNTVPRYNGTTCTMQGSGVTISDTNVVTASGGFVGNLTGNANTATKLQTARTIGGVSFDGTADINLPGVNTAGNQSTTGNAATATKLNTTRSNYKDITDSVVVGELMWKNYGNGHTIFDASNSTTPIGTATSNTNPDYVWNPTYPTLMGYTGSSTCGVRVDSSRYADQLKTARTINGVSFDGSANITIPSIPTGGIIMWSGSIVSIPTGWALCNGLNGTPDLQDRFVVGAGSAYAVGSTGGSKDAIVVSHTHTQAAHSHTAITSSAGEHTHTISGYAYERFSSTSVIGATSATWTASTNSSGAHTHSLTTNTVTPTINSTGSSGTNANLPPYYALAYIMKL